MRPTVEMAVSEFQRIMSLSISPCVSVSVCLSLSLSLSVGHIYIIYIGWSCFVIGRRWAVLIGSLYPLIRRFRRRRNSVDGCLIMRSFRCRLLAPPVVRSSVSLFSFGWFSGRFWNSGKDRYRVIGYLRLSCYIVSLSSVMSLFSVIALSIQGRLWTCTLQCDIEIISLL